MSRTPRPRGEVIRRTVAGILRDACLKAIKAPPVAADFLTTIATDRPHRADFTDTTLKCEQRVTVKDCEPRVEGVHKDDKKSRDKSKISCKKKNVLYHINGPVACFVLRIQSHEGRAVCAQPVNTEKKRRAAATELSLHNGATTARETVGSAFAFVKALLSANSGVQPFFFFLYRIVSRGKRAATWEVCAQRVWELA